jgi:hypothetical protein
MPFRTPIDLKFKTKVGKHVRRLYVKFQLDPTVRLRIMIVAVKLDRCTFYVKIRIWPCLDHIIYFQGRPAHTLTRSIFIGDLPSHSHWSFFTVDLPHMFIMVSFQGRPTHMFTRSIFMGDLPSYSHGQGCQNRDSTSKIIRFYELV